MPYIHADDRSDLDPTPMRPPNNPGELNYQFTVLAIQYVQANGLSYQSINDVVGALHGAASEFQRRVGTPYEEFKIIANTDVYPPEVIKKRPRVWHADGTVTDR